jgi:hypothetical protein
MTLLLETQAQERHEILRRHLRELDEVDERHLQERAGFMQRAGHR